MSLADAARRLLHHDDEKWSPQVSPYPYCWACLPAEADSLAELGLCADCHIRAAATAYREGRAVFTHLDHIGGERSHTDSPSRGLDR